MSKKKKYLKIVSRILLVLLIVIVVGLIFPTWTPKIEGKNSISELRKVEINGESIEIMIRGYDKDNPIILFVHGGPCCSEIPYVVKYQKKWEDKFTIVHYDQRGSGKSFEFFKDYSEVTAGTHVEDLLELTEYITEYLGQEQVILAGHSYGTYIAMNAVSQKSELYRAYVGIGQMSNTVESELDTLEKCISAAESERNTEDVSALEELRKQIESGDMIVPRSYVRKYGFGARGIDDNADYIKGFLFRPEYNLSDAIHFYTAAIKYQDALIKEALDNPITDIVTEVEVPVYFLMGKYDGMTSPEAAEDYLNNLVSQHEKEFVIFEESAHYPQFEESNTFYNWLCEKFGGNMQ